MSAIGVEHLDSLKTWLDNCNIKFYETAMNMNWGQIIKHINSMGLQEFYDEGGWRNPLGNDNSGSEVQPTSYSLQPTSYLLHPTSYILPPTSYILHLTSYIFYISLPPGLLDDGAGC